MGPGDRIGRYVIESLLGEGGMGQVFRAYDKTLRRRVAIKLLRTDARKRPDGATPSQDEAGAWSTERVLREARMAASLEHPNVIGIYDVGEHEGVPFIVMELVKGPSLRTAVGQPGVPALERVRWLVDVARALGAAHRVGMVHRDVKPENVLVREDGVVKVLDFGIARLSRTPSLRPPAPGDEPPPSAALPDLTAATETAATVDKSTFAGTSAYMAPEQIRGEASDARADQFAWGVLAYELLTGRVPWIHKPGNVSLLLAVLEAEPAPLSAEQLGIPPAFAQAVMRALSKRRDERFASMEDLVLATGLAPLPGDSRPSLPAPGSADTTGPRISLSPDMASAPTLLATHSAGSLGGAAANAIAKSDAGKRRRNLAVAAGAAAVLVGGTLAMLAARRSPDDRATLAAPSASGASARSTPLVFQPREPRRLTYGQGCEEYPSMSPDGATVVYDTSVGDDVHVAALDIATGAERRLTTEPGWHYSPAVSPDGKLVAYLRQHGDEQGTWVVPLDGSAPARLLVHGRTRPMWTPDGRALWAGFADHPQRIDLESGQPTRTLEPPPGYLVLRVRELADGRAVGRVFDKETKRGRGLVLYGATGATPSTFFADDTEDAIAITPDGARVLAPKLLATQRVELWQMPLDGSPPSIVPGNVVLPTKGMDFSKDGSRVIWSTCSTEQDLAALRAPGDKAPLVATPLEPKTEWTDEQPAGVPGSATRLVVVSDRESRRQLWVLDASGQETPRRLRTGDLEVTTPAVSPDGAWVAFTAVGKGIHIVPLDGSADARPLTSGSTDTAPAFSRDGRQVYLETSSPTRRRAIVRVKTDGSGTPETVVDGGERPWASPTDERLVYVADAPDGDEGTPTVMDLPSRRTHPLSSSLGRGVYGGLRFAPDGKRVAVTVGLTELVEVDAASGAVLRRFSSADQLTSISYLGHDVVASRQGWRGDLWMARDPWTP